MQPSGHDTCVKPPFQQDITFTQKYFTRPLMAAIASNHAGVMKHLPHFGSRCHTLQGQCRRRKLWTPHLKNNSQLSWGFGEDTSKCNRISYYKRKSVTWTSHTRKHWSTKRALWVAHHKNITGVENFWHFEQEDLEAIQNLDALGQVHTRRLDPSNRANLLSKIIILPDWKQ